MFFQCNNNKISSVLICFMLGVFSPAQQIWLISTTFQHIVPTQLVWCLDPNNMRISSNTQIMLRCLNIVTSPLLPHNWLSLITISLTRVLRRAPGDWLWTRNCGDPPETLTLLINHQRLFGQEILFCLRNNSSFSDTVHQYLSATDWSRKVQN